jgi:hypothetical protein
MDTLALEHVAVWLDSLAPRGGAFPHALDWASGLKIPLRILGLSSGKTDSLLHGALAPAGTECAAACAERGVACDVVECSQMSAAVGELFCPHGLSVFSSALASRVRDGFLRASMRAKENAILVCPASCAPVSRVLILHAPQDPTGGFLASALSTSRALGVNPVILTVARTERQARRGQLVAERACYVHRLAAHLDFVVGVDVGAAVASIARWRRCSHVFLERRQATPWWRWRQGDTLERLLGLTDSLTFLALPEAGLPAAAGRPALTA